VCLTLPQLKTRINERCNKCLSWPLFIKLTRRYTYEHIANMISLLPDRIAHRASPQQKIIYLTGLCRNKAKPSDYKQQKKLDLDMENFKL